jgi:hypothetical protein
MSIDFVTEIAASNPRFSQIYSRVADDLPEGEFTSERPVHSTI